MTLKQLEAFYWAATLGSFSIAALRLHVTPSSLSKRIAELEADIDKQLFDRTGQRAVLTDAGDRLLEHAGAMLELETRIRESLQNKENLRGVCRFGVSELIAATWFPKFVGRVRMLYPDLILEPTVDLTSRCEKRLVRGELDFAIIPGPPTSHLLAYEQICELKYSWMAAPSLLAAGTQLTAEHFLQHPIISLSSDSRLTGLTNYWASAQQIELPRALTCNSLLALIELTVAGVGISTFPRNYMQPLIEGGHLVELRSALPLPDMSYCFDWRRDDERSVVRLLRQLVIEEADFSAVTRLHFDSR
ncbi:LysR family transcriptional regulator [Pseudomonas sp. RIT-PI-q]|uniref:LysR family transcriptional regulator n=1 Tax=Pseudomonas sp. RIT-PI-q TaxID=1690247 RepID=UPI0006CD824B|nr:LysR family transcriptional regulator [Pseudomonas sp. RIT-PI-q]KPG95991.1 LysR family transcriptional regulator [Pseudomonas sp. RIT-PI-q]